MSHGKIATKLTVFRSMVSRKLKNWPIKRQIAARKKIISEIPIKYPDKYRSPERCPLCRRKVYMPCLFCQINNKEL